MMQVATSKADEAMTATAPPAAAKGKRPAFFDDPAIDALLTAVLELAQETSVLKDRLVAYEAYMASKGLGDAAEFEAFALPADLAARRAEERAALIKRLFRVIERSE